jgi:hypothetical protein
MKTISIFFALLLGLSQLNVFAQDSTYQQFTDKNAVFVKVGGYTVLDLNYDRIIYQKKNVKYSLGMGLLFFTKDERSEDRQFYYYDENHHDVFFTFSLEANQIRGRKNHHFEWGLNYSRYYYENYSPETFYVRNDTIWRNISYNFNSHHALSLKLGYRYQRPKGGFMFRFMVYPFGITNEQDLGVDSKKRFSALGVDDLRLRVISPLPSISLGWSF